MLWFSVTCLNHCSAIVKVLTEYLAQSEYPDRMGFRMKPFIYRERTINYHEKKMSNIKRKYCFTLLAICLSSMFFSLATAQIFSVTAACTLDPKFQQAFWSIGDTYYTDRNYTIRHVSEPRWFSYCLQPIIKTPNDERNNTQSNGYLKFEMPFPGSVNIAFDSRLTSLPNWVSASGFYETVRNKIYTSLSSQPYMQLYSKLYNFDECVDLGGELGSRSKQRTTSNYVVFTRENYEPCYESPCGYNPKFRYGFANNDTPYYTDRSYTITNAGPFSGMKMITTPNDDRYNTQSSDYLKFEMPHFEPQFVGGYVYVAYDRRASSPPNWLTSSFTRIPCARIDTSLSSQGWLDVYKSNRFINERECINLGGNRVPDSPVER